MAYFTAFGERMDVGWRTAYTFAGDWGYRDDGDMGLLYIGARWYDPAVGRWTSADKWLGNIYQPLSLNRLHGIPLSLYRPTLTWSRRVTRQTYIQTMTLTGYATMLTLTQITPT